MANFVLGKDCKAYYSATPLTSTSYATPLAAATELSNIKDLKINFQTDKTEITTRASGGWKENATTLKDGSISFNMKWLPADAGFSAILTAWINNAEIAFYALDGAKGTAGFQGPAGNWNVSNFSRIEDLSGAVMVDVELTPSSYSGWVVTA